MVNVAVQISAGRRPSLQGAADNASKRLSVFQQCPQTTKHFAVAGLHNFRFMMSQLTLDIYVSIILINYVVNISISFGISPIIAKTAVLVIKIHYTSYNFAMEVLP